MIRLDALCTQFCVVSFRGNTTPKVFFIFLMCNMSVFSH